MPPSTRPHMPAAPALWGPRTFRGMQSPPPGHSGLAPSSQAWAQVLAVLLSDWWARQAADNLGPQVPHRGEGLSSQQAVSAWRWATWGPVQACCPLIPRHRAVSPPEL